MPFFEPTLRLDELPSAFDLAEPAKQETRSITDRAGFSWEGIITARAFPADMTDEEILLMRVGGNRKRLALPDHDGLYPVYVLTDAESREARRLLDTNCLGGVEHHNTACNGGRNVLLNFLTIPLVANNTGYTGIVAFAVGDTAATPGATDTALAHEVFRKQITSSVIGSNYVSLICNFAANEGNYTYQDAGIFGSSPTSTASGTTVNTGVLFAHANYSYTKSSSVVLSNDYYVYFN